MELCHRAMSVSRQLILTILEKSHYFELASGFQPVFMASTIEIKLFNCFQKMHHFIFILLFILSRAWNIKSLGFILTSTCLRRKRGRQPDSQKLKEIGK